MSEILTVGGVVYVGRPDTKRRSALHTGRHVGWFPAPGIRTWTKDVSVAKKSAITPELKKEFGLVLPEESAKKHNLADAARAAESCALVAVTPELAPKLIAKGVRVYSIGCDRITGGIYFFAEGGTDGPMRLQGDLISMVAPNLPDGATNNEIEDVVESVVDRLISQLSGGALTELEVELAEALPKLGEDDPTETLQTFEGFMLLGRSRSEKYAKQAGTIAATLEAAQKSGSATAKIELFQEAFSETQPPLTLTMNAGGEDRAIKLPARTRWITTQDLNSVRPPPVAPVATAATTGTPAAAPAPTGTPAAAPVAAKKPAVDPAIEAKKKADEAAAAKKAADDAAAAKKAADDAAAKKAADEAAKAKAAQEAAAKKAADDAAAKAKADAEAAKKAADDAVAAKAKAEADAVAAKAKAEADAAAKAKADEAAAIAKQAADEAAAVKAKADEEAAAAKKIADEAAAAKKKTEDEAAAAKKAADDAVTAKKKAEDDAVAAKKKADYDEAKANKKNGTDAGKKDAALAKASDKPAAVKKIDGSVPPASENLTLPTTKLPVPYIVAGIVLVIVVLYFIFSKS